MKKIISLVTIISCLGTISVFAQPKNGYYRIQNASSNNYLSNVNNKVDEINKELLKNGGGGMIYSLRMKTKDEVVSDPGSIIYLTKGASGYVLDGQGMNTYKLTGLYLELTTGALKRADGVVLGTTLPDAYFMYGSASGARRYLYESKTKSTSDPDYKDNQTVYYHVAYAVGADASGWSLADRQANWYFKEIDNNNEYFAITPSIELNGKWYGTMYCSLNFKVSEGMTAYYIKKYTTGQSQAQLIKIEDGIVPANTGVIIECTSKNPADNKLTLLTDAELTKKYSGVLRGEYYCYIPRKATNGQNENANLEKDLKNAKATNNNIRVLDVSNGKLSLVRPSESQLVVTDKGKYIPANIAYMEIAGSASVIELTTGEVSGISAIENNIQTSDVFNLQGQKVAAKGTTIDELPRGLYIIGGKKIIKD